VLPVASQACHAVETLVCGSAALPNCKDQKRGTLLSSSGGHTGVVEQAPAKVLGHQAEAIGGSAQLLEERVLREQREQRAGQSGERQAGKGAGLCGERLGQQC
jgi:hypothetical protein